MFIVLEDIPSCGTAIKKGIQQVILDAEVKVFATVGAALGYFQNTKVTFTEIQGVFLKGQLREDGETQSGTELLELVPDLHGCGPVVVGFPEWFANNFEARVDPYNITRGVVFVEDKRTTPPGVAQVPLIKTNFDIAESVQRYVARNLQKAQ